MNKIPKIIHFVWVGKNPKPPIVIRCMQSWKKYCPDYEIMEWNENNFDINSHHYTKEAYENKKWAFVSDYIRLYALQKYGGVYMDTDLEVYKNMDKFLEHSFFTGFENQENPVTAIMGSIKNHPLLKELIEDYDNRKLFKDEKMDYTNVNTGLITNILINRYNVKRNNHYQILKNDVHIYPDHILCANPYIYGIEIPDGCYTRHHSNFSWEDNTHKITRYRNIVFKIFMTFLTFDKEKYKKIFEKIKYRIIYHNKLK